MAKAVLTVGVTANLDKFLGQTLKIDTSDTATIGDKFTRAFVQGTGLALTNTLVYGESPEAFLKKTSDQSTGWYRRIWSIYLWCQTIGCQWYRVY